MTNVSAPDYPWLKSYPPDADWHAPLRDGPLPDIMDAAVAAFPENPCLDFLGRKYTYGEVGELIERAARGFQDMGVGKGVRVGLLLPNTPYYVICYFAILKIGGTVVNYNPLYVERELIGQVEDSGTHIMVTLDIKELFVKCEALVRDSGLGKVVVCPMADILPPLKRTLFRLLKRSAVARFTPGERFIPFARLIKKDGRPDPVEINPATHIAVLQYTGGTTGVPKGAMLTHANLSANTDQSRLWFPGLVPGEERILAVLPFFHVFAMTTVLNLGVSVAAEIVMLPRFEMKPLLKTVSRMRPTLFPAVPTIYTAINNSPLTAAHDLTSIRYCISGGAPLPLEVKTRFEALTGCSLVEGYGLTESSPVAVCNPPSGINKDGSIGLPLPGTRIEIRDPDDPTRLMGVGERGEVCILGPQVMAGYWQRPDETAQTIIEGRLHTGDVGYMDGDGYVFLVDRIKDMIISSGYKVYPRTLEEAVYLHPSVAEAIAIAIPDPYRGQAGKIFISLRPGEELSPDDMKAFLKDKLSAIEMPAEIEFRADLPKTMIGKLSKKELVEEERVKAAAASGTG